MEAIILSQITITAKRIFDFQGTATRKEYWTFYFLFFIVLTIALEIDEFLGVTVFFNLVFLGLLLPLIACGTRRMHDVNKSGWHQFIPLYNFFLLIKPSTERKKISEEKKQKNHSNKIILAEEKRILKAKHIEEIIVKEKTDEEKRMKRILDEDTIWKKSNNQITDDKKKSPSSSGLKNSLSKIQKNLEDMKAENARAMASIICPFCQTKGSVTTKKKNDTSGVKATGAVLTLGMSVMLTGLHKHSTRIEANCSQCKTTWDMANRKW
jgi:uncharacterized membrane protein YhaH (DUF805 family)